MSIQRKLILAFHFNVCFPTLTTYRQFNSFNSKQFAKIFIFYSGVRINLNYVRQYLK